MNRTGRRSYASSNTLRNYAINKLSFLGVVVVMTCFLFVGCRKEPPPAPVAAPHTARENGNISAKDIPPVAPLSEAEDRGDFKIQYGPRKTSGPRTAASHRVASNPQNLGRIITELNDRIALPFDIDISFQDCDEPGAYYDPETHGLTLCHQLIDEYYQLFSRGIKDEKKLDEAVMGATAATFFHELGHALIDVWKLPVTGKEEDAVDQLSTLVLIDHTEEGEKLALDWALSFKYYAERDKRLEKLYWDEHSFDEQRYYDIICLIYGRDPERHAGLVGDATLPEERAELCREDYPKIYASWARLLQPHLKKAPQTRPKLKMR